MKNTLTIGIALVASISALTPTSAIAQNALSVKGSDTMLQLAQAWADAYHKSKNKIITVTGGGSTTGIAALVNGSTDIANSSRPMKSSEVEKAKARGFVPFEIPVAKDGLAIVVNPKNPLTKLTMEQLKGLYDGSIKNWSQIGGPAAPVVTIGRDSSSGTYGFFQDVVLSSGPYRQDMQTTPSTNAIAQTVSSDVGAVGYVGVAYAKAFGDKVKIIPIARTKSAEAIEPTDANVKNGKYALWRYLFVYTKGKPSGAAKEFIDWCRSKEGQDVVEKVGYYTVK